MNEYADLALIILWISRIILYASMGFSLQTLWNFKNSMKWPVALSILSYGIYIALNSHSINPHWIIVPSVAFALTIWAVTKAFINSAVKKRIAQQRQKALQRNLRRKAI